MPNDIHSLHTLHWFSLCENEEHHIFMRCENTMDFFRSINSTGVISYYSILGSIFCYKIFQYPPLPTHLLTPPPSPHSHLITPHSSHPFKHSHTPTYHMGLFPECLIPNCLIVRMSKPKMSNPIMSNRC